MDGSEVSPPEEDVELLSEELDEVELELSFELLAPLELLLSVLHAVSDSAVINARAPAAILLLLFAMLILLLR